MAEPQIIYVKPEEVDRYWFLVEHKLGKAIEYSDHKYSLASVYNEIKDCTMQLWAIKVTYDLLAVCVTQIVNYPDKKVLLIMFVGGDKIDLYKHLIHEIARYARAMKCQSIEFYGRHGWKSKMQEFGFEHIHSVFRLKLDKEGANEKDIHKIGIRV